MGSLVKPLLNTATFLLVLTVNFLSATGLIGPKSVGEISDRYPTVVTPAGYAFSIWGLIYLLLLLFIGYQWYSWKKKGGSDLLDKTGYYFTLSNLANALWVVVWVNDRIALSLVLIIILLGSLIKLVQRLNLERWDAPLPVILFVWWPLAIYFGWVILASIVNAAVFFVSLGYGDALWGAAVWGAVLVVASTFVYLYLIYTRNLRESAAVGIWGLTAIAFRQAEAHPSIAVFAMTGSVVLLVNIAYHAYRNRGSSVFRKI